MTLGEYIKQIRTNRSKDNQTNFANALGITQSYLSQIENGNRPPTMELLKSISDYVGVPLPILFWFGVEASDVPNSESFDTLKPVIDSMMNELIRKL